MQNAGEKPLEISTFGQLKQSITLPPHLDTGSSNFALHTFRGAAYSTPDEKYEKYKFDTIADNENLNISSKGGWVAMLQQYFATAWIPLTTVPTTSIPLIWVTASPLSAIISAGTGSAWSDWRDEQHPVVGPKFRTKWQLLLRTGSDR